MASFLFLLFIIMKNTNSAKRLEFNIINMILSNAIGIWERNSIRIIVKIIKLMILNEITRVDCFRSTTLCILSCVDLSNAAAGTNSSLSVCFKIFSKLFVSK